MSDREHDSANAHADPAPETVDVAPDENAGVHRAPGRDLGEVSAQTVLLERSGAESITAETLRMERSGARSIDAGCVEMDRSGTVALGCDHAVLRHSSAVQVVGEHVELFDSRAVIVVTQRATIDRSRVILFVGNAEGDVHTVFTSRSAAIAGGAFAVVLAVGSVLLRSRNR